MAPWLTRRGAVAMTAALGAGAALWSTQRSEALDRARLGRVLFDEDFRDFQLYDEKTGRGRWRTQFANGGPIDGEYSRTHGDVENQCFVDPGFRGLGLNPFRVRRTSGGAELDILLRPTPPRLRAALFDRPFISGMISSEPVFATTEAYWEVVTRLPRSIDGIWPAIWLLPADKSWPPEIDMLEVLHGKPVFTVHTHENGAHEFDATTPRGLGDLSDRFHTLGLWKDRRQIAWYLDGRLVKRVHPPRDHNKPFFFLSTLSISQLKAKHRLDPASSASLSLRRVRAYALPKLD